MSISSEAKKEVERLLREGQKIQAINYLQDTFNISLTEAQTLVEAVQYEQVAQPQSFSADNSFSQSSTALDGQLKARVLQLLQANKKIEAVKLVRMELNTGLKEALVLVDEVHREWDPNYKPVQLGAGCLKTGAKVVAAIFGIISFLFLAIAGIIYYIQNRSIENSELIKGKVVELKYTADGSAPIISYQWEGRDLQYSPNMYSTPPAYSVNEDVYIYVNRDNPQDVLIDTFTDRWLSVAICAGIGAFFMFFTIIFYWAGRKAKT